MIIIMRCPECSDRMRKFVGRTAKVACCDRCDVRMVLDAECSGQHVRYARHIAHRVFDRIWLDQHMTRKQAYAWMAEAMLLNSDDAHISKFNPTQCEELARRVRRFMINSRSRSL